jgi:hypothetical protein
LGLENWAIIPCPDHYYSQQITRRCRSPLLALPVPPAAPTLVSLESLDPAEQQRLVVPIPIPIPVAIPVRLLFSQR